MFDVSFGKKKRERRRRLEGVLAPTIQPPRKQRSTYSPHARRSSSSCQWRTATSGHPGRDAVGRKREETEFHWVTTRSPREHLKVLNGPEHGAEFTLASLVKLFFFFLRISCKTLDLGWITTTWDPNKRERSTLIRRRRRRGSPFYSICRAGS